ncbi:MAG TPA: class I SAM-dependent methyltransferase [Pyrinomonadaceae bacterium]|jgi:SAM-dependent methyltransferase
MEENNLLPGERRCPACDFAGRAERGQKNNFQLVSCLKCKTLYTSRLPDAEHAEDYDSYYSDENLSVPDFINQRLSEIVGEFAGHRQNGRLLDVGFGAGTLMQAAARAGWTPTGVEISQRAVEHVGAMGFDVFCGTLAAARYPDNHFDVVTASEVLEHVGDPREVVAEIARVLRPGGLLWGTTPHVRGISGHALGLKWSVIAPPEHLQLFSLKGLKRMLAAAGLRRVRLTTQGVNPFEILQSWRSSRSAGGQQMEGFNRVEAGYQLNRQLMSSPSRRVLKGALNGMLNLGRIGDSLKIWAEK